MRRLALVTVVLAVAVLAAAQTPTPLTLNVDRDFKLIATYPLEVKYSSHVRIVLDLTALKNVTIDRLWVRVVLVHETGAVILVDRVLLRTKRLPPGHQYLTTIEFIASIPRPVPPVDPFLELYLTIEYLVNGTPKFFGYKAPISIVARMTYSELTSALADARREAALAAELARRVRELELKLANMSGRCAVLSEQVKKLSSELALLKEKLGMLKAENALLRARVSELEGENVKLRGEVVTLREERGGLASRLTSARESYEALKQSYGALSSEASTLRAALVALAAAVAVLVALLVLRRGSGWHTLLRRRGKPQHSPPHGAANSQDPNPPATPALIVLY